MAKRTYKTVKYLNCPYCNLREERVKMVSHIEKKHPDLIPEGYTAARVVFNTLHKKEHGNCVICGGPTEWDEKLWKYKRICEKDKCREELRNRYKKNMERVGKPIMLSEDPERIKKMVAGRSISGNYRFSDGGIRSYTGSYEKKCLEFFDKVLEVPSKDIMTPGPTFEYEYEGHNHMWITDIFYIPANLVIEVKDGGDNPNNREMVSYREKQIAKEKMITDLGKYNYLRLTNNNFVQLFETLAQIKERMISDEEYEVIININEEVGGLPPQHPRTDRVYVIPYGFNNVFSGDIEGVGFTNSKVAENILTISDGIIKSENMKEFLENRMYGVYAYKLSNITGYTKILEAWKNETKVSDNFFYEALTEKESYDLSDVIYDKSFNESALILESSITNGIIGSSIISALSELAGTKLELPVMNESVLNSLKEIKEFKVKEDQDGLFMDLGNGNRTRSDSVDGLLYSYQILKALNPVSLIKGGNKDV